MRLSFLVLGLLMVGCSSAQISGSGNIVSETRELSGFTGVALESTGDITLTQGDSEALTIEADDNLLPLLTSEVQNGVLVLGVKDNAYIEGGRRVLYTLTVTSLDSLELSGSGNVGASDLTLDALSVDISGSGNITLSGTVTTQTVNISGSGNYDACALQSDSSSLSISGSGDISVAAAVTLSVDISGTGDVTYVGNPEVSQNVSGVGDIEQIEDCN
jgi:hypothetical protein